MDPAFPEKVSNANGADDSTSTASTRALPGSRVARSFSLSRSQSCDSGGHPCAGARTFAMYPSCGTNCSVPGISARSDSTVRPISTPCANSAMTRWTGLATTGRVRRP